jgi:predicted DNA-binding transcriptional regulator AlpA
MPKKWLRFQDLKTRGLVNSWPALTNKIRTQDFPPGRMLGPNTRAWSVEEIEAFEESRPSAGPPLRGAAKAAKGRPPKDRQREAANEAAAVT